MAHVGHRSTSTEKGLYSPQLACVGRAMQGLHCALVAVGDVEGCCCKIARTSR